MQGKPAPLSNVATGFGPNDDDGAPAPSPSQLHWAMTPASSHDATQLRGGGEGGGGGRAVGKRCGTIGAINIRHSPCGCSNGVDRVPVPAPERRPRREGGLRRRGASDVDGQEVAPRRPHEDCACCRVCADAAAEVVHGCVCWLGGGACVERGGRKVMGWRLSGSGGGDRRGRGVGRGEEKRTLLLLWGHAPSSATTGSRAAPPAAPAVVEGAADDAAAADAVAAAASSCGADDPAPACSAPLLMGAA